MAIVTDRANPDNGTFPPLTTPNRSNAGTPNGAITPEFVGEIIFDTTNKVRWKATGAANTDWRPLEAEVT
jgi:hypothetical protein